MSRCKSTRITREKNPIPSLSEAVTSTRLHIKHTSCFLATCYIQSQRLKVREHPTGTITKMETNQMLRTN